MTGHASRVTGNGFRLWWRAARPYAYPASVVPVLLGAALAFADGISVSLWRLALTLVGVVAAHTGGNLMNDYFDFTKGFDRAGTLGGSGVLVSGLMTPRGVLAGAIISFAAAAAAGLPLVVAAGWPVALLAFFGLASGVGYVAPPFGFKYRALGDVIVLLAFGVGITLGSYFVQALRFSWAPVAAGAAYGLWVVALLHCNNMRDMADDAADGTRTVAGLLGNLGARVAYAAVVLGSYALVALFAASGALPRGALLCFITLPLGAALVARVSPSYSDRETLAAAVPRTAQYSLFFGLAMTAGVAADKLMR